MPALAIQSDDDLRRFWKGLTESIERSLGSELFGAIVSDVRQSGVATPLPLADDPDTLRFLGRLGVIPHHGDSSGGAVFLARLSSAVERTGALTSVLVRLFASGLYGSWPDGMCGMPPHCSDCGVSRFCQTFHAPRIPPATARAHRADALLRGALGAAVGPEDILALVLGGGRATDQTMSVASDLLSRYGSFRRLSQATLGELERFAGITPGQAARVAACAAFSKYLSEEKRRIGASVRSGRDFFELYHERLRDEPQESFFIVLLDTRNRIIRDEQAAKGTLESVVVSPRDVFAAAIREGARAIVCIHNHPSGDPTPSPEDKKLTAQIASAARILQICFLDHIIIGDGAYTSFVDEGLMPT